MIFKPHEYQKYCIHRMVDYSARGIFLGMGLGKTVITLTAVDEMIYNRFDVRKVLVIAPKFVAQDTWTREAQKWDHLKHLRIVPVLGSRQQREAALRMPGDVYVINRENVPWLVDVCGKGWPFDCVVIDELSSFKNPSAKRFKRLRAVRPQIKRLYGLTGTPAAKGFLGLWSQLYLMDSGERLGKTFGGYRERYFSPDKRGPDRIFSWKLRDGAESSIRGSISDICISMDSRDYLDVPEMIVNDIPVVLDPKARRAYDEFERTTLLPVDDEVIDAATAGVLTGKLLQAANGAIYDAAGDWHTLHDAKIEALGNILDCAQGESVLVFYEFKHDAQRIREAFGKSYKIGELKSPESIKNWNDGKLDVLLAHPASAAYGLNLQDGGHIIVWFGLTWQTELYQQAVARLHRQGQTETVIVNRLITQDTRDEDVALSMSEDVNTQAAFLDSLKARIKRAKNE